MCDVLIDIEKTGCIVNNLKFQWCMDDFHVVRYICNKKKRLKKTELEKKIRLVNFFFKHDSNLCIH